MQNLANDVLIRRTYKHEAEQAIRDLEKRGYHTIYPLSEIKRDGKTFMNDGYKRKIFVENTSSSCWMAKLRKGEKNA